MKSEDERKWFDFHGIQPELAELYRYLIERSCAIG